MKTLRIFGLGESTNLADDIAQNILGRWSHGVTVDWRPDGEAWAAAEENVRGADCFVVSSLYGDVTRSVNDKTIQLLLFIDALKRASAGRVTAVIPYLSYMRQDRKEGSREPVSTQALAKMFEAVGTDRILTLDAHNPGALQNAFRIPIDMLEAKKLLAGMISDDLNSNDFDNWYLEGVRRTEGRKVVVISPDAGGVKRAKAFQECLAKRVANLGIQVDFAYADKTRDSGSGVEIHEIIGDIACKTCIVVDDMISTGSTIKKLQVAINKFGGNLFYVVATHGIFVGNSESNLESIPRVFVSDSISNPDFSPENSRMVNTSALFAEAINRIHFDNGSISDLLKD